MSNTVKVKLLRTHVIGRPGEIIVAFGHQFVMQENGDVVCDMHKDFIKTEVQAGRVEVIEPGKPEIKDNTVPELMMFSMEVKDYYGLGTSERLAAQLARLRKELLQEFAATRLSIKIPESVPNDKMLKQITSLVQTAHQQYGEPEQSEQSETASNDKDHDK
jgi:hypothetical protein